MTVLSTTHLCLRARRHTLCQSLSLHVQPGDIIGILGSNGCGKTTLLHTLAGFRPPFTGDVLLDNKPLQHFSAKALARCRGVLFQDTHHALPITVNDYCESSRYPHQPFFSRSTVEDKALITNTLQQLELTHVSHVPITQLSGGEKRRLAIAALLIQQPSIYLLDEPTNHLDIRHQISVLNHFAALALSKQTSIIMTLHDVRLARTYCTRILLIFSDGQTLEGSPDTMLTHTNLSRLYGCDVSAILY